LDLLWNQSNAYQWRMTTPTLSPALDALPWQPVSPGFHLKVVRGSSDDNDTCVLLLRLEPGTVIARHRHAGEIHALNLAGSREILDTGEVIGPGGYVYEPPGNVDSWRAIGDDPVIVFLTARGAIEYIDGRDQVLSRSTTASVSERYRAFAATGVVPGG
jgi:quercetin dioxygenase-like cupin family protein